MSWSIDIIGKKQDVKAAVVAQEYIPASIKAVVAEFCDAGMGPDAYDTPPEAVHVVSHGHFDRRQGSSSIGMFTFNAVTLAPPAPVPPPPDAPAATKPLPTAT